MTDNSILLYLSSVMFDSFIFLRTLCSVTFIIRREIYQLFTKLCPFFCYFFTSSNIALKIISLIYVMI